MPEIGEIARIVHFLRMHAVGKTVASVRTQEDDIVYGRVGTSASAFEKAMTGKRVVGAGQQGKYFWLEMSAPPHPVMHFGMTGWMKFDNDDSAYYRPRAAEAEWPPKFWKFVLRMDGDPGNEIAFVDSRRFARIRLVDAEGAEIRKASPLKENGPDPVVDREIVTKEWLASKMKNRRIPVKALLLDQAVLSGVGNWVADEVLYQAKIHPEQYSNAFSDYQIGVLHESLMNVCKIAVETLADSNQFPQDWLMKYRWSKGKKDNRLPNGERISFLTVGGRTSAIVASRQKKTGPVAGDANGATKSEDEDDAEEVKQEDPPKPAKRRKPAPEPKDGGLPDGEDSAEEGKGKKKSKKPKTKAQIEKAPAKTVVAEESGQRRSTRISNQG